ncbi:MAG: tetratricopeptide repeat protein [Acidobacteriia bacterium]|nr:tetratricopeptide repeat protein [Terriglobia bacterium]
MTASSQIRSKRPIDSTTGNDLGKNNGTFNSRVVILACVAVLAIFATYANHFHNSFHFDDSHSIVTNVYIRDLHNIPKFFTDGRTFSSLPANQTWRPLVSASLALDYYLGGGLKPLWFHVSTFFWFLVQLGLMFLLYESLLNAVALSPLNRYIALFTTTWYGLHPVNAETVNYIIQRGDLYSTLGVVAGLVAYIRLPKLRRFGLYLFPVVLGAMAKPPAVMFGTILLAYIFLFEEDADWRRWWPALRKALPALLVCGILAVINIKLTPKSFTPAIIAHGVYWATQPFVALKYVRSLFLPLWLSADTDMLPFAGFSQPVAMAGVLSCVALAGVALWTTRKREYRPISFGIIWFFIALAPTSLVVLSEVENDHRMFFPFVGLILSVTWTAYLALARLLEDNRKRSLRLALCAAAVSLLFAYAVGTWHRNRIWLSEESLWYDVTVKSPQNGRGLMNYGLTKMSKGDAKAAIAYFDRATRFTPNYYVLEINLGIAHGLPGHTQESEAHFRRAISLAPNDAQPYFYYGRWLKLQGRFGECIQAERSALERNPAFIDARYLLMQSYLEQRQWAALRELAQDTLQLSPSDPEARRYLTRSESGQNELAIAEQQARQEPTPQHFLSLSLFYHQGGKYKESIEAAKKALQLKPDYAEAYNNIAAAYEAMHQWDPAIEAAQRALRLKPDFQLAKNNLAYSLAQKKLNTR